MLWGLGARSGAAPRVSGRGGVSAGRAAVSPLAAARRSVPGAAGPARRGEASATAAFPAGQHLVPTGSGPVPRCPQRPGADMSRRPAETWETPLSSPLAAGRRAGAALGGRRPRPGAGRNPRANASPLVLCLSPSRLGLAAAAGCKCSCW